METERGRKGSSRKSLGCQTEAGVTRLRRARIVATPCEWSLEESRNMTKSILTGHLVLTARLNVRCFIYAFAFGSAVAIMEARL